MQQINDFYIVLFCETFCNKVGQTPKHTAPLKKVSRWLSIRGLSCRTKRKNVRPLLVCSNNCICQLKSQQYDCWRNRTQEKSYPREIVPKLNGYDFSGEIVPWVRLHQRYRTQGTISPEISYPDKEILIR